MQEKKWNGYHSWGLILKLKKAFPKFAITHTVYAACKYLPVSNFSTFQMKSDHQGRANVQFLKFVILVNKENL